MTTIAGSRRETPVTAFGTPVKTSETKGTCDLRLGITIANPLGIDNSKQLFGKFAKMNLKPLINAAAILAAGALGYAIAPAAANASTFTNQTCLGSPSGSNCTIYVADGSTPGGGATGNLGDVRTASDFPLQIFGNITITFSGASIVRSQGATNNAALPNGATFSEGALENALWYGPQDLINQLTVDDLDDDEDSWTSKVARTLYELHFGGGYFSVLFDKPVIATFIRTEASVVCGTKPNGQKKYCKSGSGWSNVRAFDIKQDDGGGSTTPVPVPPAAMFFASGLAGMGFLKRRRKAISQN